MLFNLSCILILSRASGLTKDIPKSVHGDDTLTSKGNRGKE